MVDVGAKPQSRRRARARALVDMRPETASKLAELPKGDALTTAQVAGIMAAKRTSDLVPLCHPLPLTAIGVHVAIGENVAEITTAVETTAQTGVTIYDMAKAVDESMVIREVRLLEKTKEEV